MIRTKIRIVLTFKTCYQMRFGLFLDCADCICREAAICTHHIVRTVISFTILVKAAVGTTKPVFLCTCILLISCNTATKNEISKNILKIRTMIRTYCRTWVEASETVLNPHCPAGFMDFTLHTFRVRVDCSSHQFCDSPAIAS